MQTIPAPSFSGRVPDFLAYCRARNFSENTVRAYRADLADFFNRTGETITRRAVLTFIMLLHDDELARKSIRRKVASLKSFCKWLEVEGLIDASLVQSIRGPRLIDSLPDVPSEGDMKRLLDGKFSGRYPERDRCILELLYSCGLRASEVCGINVDDRIESDVLLIRGKGKKERFVVAGEYAQDAMKAWLKKRRAVLTQSGKKQDTAALFFGDNTNCERLDVRTLRRALDRVTTARGLPRYHPHLLRHACGTHMHDRGAPLQAIAVLLGHAKLSTTQIYTRVSTGRMLDTYRKAHPHATV